MALQEGERVRRVAHLFEADEIGALALAVAAAPHVEAQHGVAPGSNILQGSMQELDLQLLPKPCSTMKAGYFLPGGPAGTCRTPLSFRPSDMKVTDCSGIEAISP